VNGHYYDRGEGQNRLPHLLYAVIDDRGWGNVRWRVECPYEGVRDCGVLVPCTEHKEPTQPRGLTGSAKRRAEQRFLQAYDEWHDLHGYGAAEHPGSECWFEHMLTEGDIEPEYFLADIPNDTPLTWPLEIRVGHEGSYDESTPIFTTWKDRP